MNTRILNNDLDNLEVEVSRYFSELLEEQEEFIIFAEEDCYGNEYVTKCTDLPEHHQQELLKQISKYYENN